MLTEFESRLADVLGSRLPAPFAGRVRRRDAPAPAGAGPVIRLGVDSITPLEPDFGSVRPEVVPGSTDFRHVLRLGVTVGVDIEPEDGEDHIERLLGIDAVIYALQHPDLRSAQLLVQPGDQGFVLDWLHLGDSDLDADVVVLTQGWFWPVGQTGEAGREIERALVREFRLPVQLGIGGVIEAGGPDVALNVSFGATGTLQVTGTSVTGAPFGSVAMRLVDSGGGPGAGTLAGGDDGPDGTQLVDVTNGTASVDYEPPNAAAVDQLVVAAHARDADGNEHLGVELARFDLVVAP
jgi:hypothetical protein